MYRDASNYKKFNEVVLEGRLTEDQIKDCLENASDGVEFIPYQVGLEDLQPQMDSYPSADDHVWHTFESVEPTEEPLTEGLNLTAEELRKNFQARKGNWDVVAACRKHGFEL